MAQLIRGPPQLLVKHKSFKIILIASSLSAHNCGDIGSGLQEPHIKEATGSVEKGYPGSFVSAFLLSFVDIWVYPTNP